MDMQKSEIGLIGLATMGANLALNIERNGFSIAVYNRTAERTREFMSRRASGKNITPCYTIDEFVNSLEKPRRIILMVKAGEAVDEFINLLMQKLEPGDVIVDCGNSFFKDTERRQKILSEKGIYLMGVGVSGGEEGALKGPCIMSGGPKDAEELLSPVFRKISAKLDDGPCYGYMGPGGAGHFVKMVHNGIEYAIIQAIAEVYDALTNILSLKPKDISEIFSEWNRNELNSFLMEISIEVLLKIDEETGRPLIDVILDKAEQKGTGKWTSQVAMDLGIPVPSVDAAVSARNISAMKELRVMTSRVLKFNPEGIQVDREELLEDMRSALYCTMIVSYAQGLSLISTASKELGYNTNLSEVARIWRGGCIIRSKLLNLIRQIYLDDPSIQNILLDRRIADEIHGRQLGWRRFVSTMKLFGIPCPAISSALDYLDSMRRDRLPANLIQALRDRFGAHGYERVDKPGRFHTKWIDFND